MDDQLLKDIGAEKYKLAVQRTLLEWRANRKNPVDHFNEFMRDVDYQNQISEVES